MNRLLAATLIALTACGPAVAREPASAGHRPPPVPLTVDGIKAVNDLFERIDGNRNGRISRSEMTSFVVASGYGNALRERMWRRTDANRSGWVSRAELSASAEAFGRPKTRPGSKPGGKHDTEGPPAISAPTP